LLLDEYTQLGSNWLRRCAHDLQFPPWALTRKKKRQLYTKKYSTHSLVASDILQSALFIYTGTRTKVQLNGQVKLTGAGLSLYVFCGL